MKFFWATSIWILIFFSTSLKCPLPPQALKQGFAWLLWSFDKATCSLLIIHATELTVCETKWAVPHCCQIATVMCRRDFCGQTVEPPATARAKKVHWVPSGLECRVRYTRHAKTSNNTQRVDKFHEVAFDSCRGSQWGGGAWRRIQAQH